VEELEFGVDFLLVNEGSDYGSNHVLVVLPEVFLLACMVLNVN